MNASDIMLYDYMNSYEHHTILFIPDQERLISVGLHDRTIIRWNIEEIETML